LPPGNLTLRRFLLTFPPEPPPTAQEVSLANIAHAVLLFQFNKE
jgi:hypothetical protein